MKPSLYIVTLSLCALSAFGFQAKVVSIADGDTCTVLTAQNKQIKIRLAGIDTPEKSQAFGTKAKQALSSKIFGKTIEVKAQTKDRYGRTVADLYIGKRWINLELVAEGYAWHYKQYSKDKRLAQAEVKARSSRKGLWSDKNPTPPWEYRKGGARGSTGQGQSKVQALPITGYWLNTSSNKRHNSNCRNYRNTKRGKNCSKNAGSPCGICGG